jgi:hypothetical protein
MLSKSFLLIMFACLCRVSILFAQPSTANFTGGGGDNNFSNGNNWNPVGVPVSGSNITIATGVSLVVDMDFACAQLRINKNSSFSFINGHTLTVTDAIVDQNGTVRIDINSSLILGSGIQVPVPGKPSGTFDIATSASEFDATVDGSGNLYCAYVSSSNVYVKKNFDAEELVGSGSNVSISVGPDGVPKIVYISGASNYTYAIWTGVNTWATESVASPDGWGNFIDIDVDINNYSHIAYVSGRHIYYINNTGGTFGSATDILYEPRVYPNPNIRVDASGYYHITYNTRSWGGQCSWSWDGMGVATNAAKGNASTGQDPTGSGCPSSGTIWAPKNGLAFDGSGNTHIVYYRRDGNYYKGTIPTGTDSWNESSLGAITTPTIDAVGNQIGIAYVSSGNVKYIEDTGGGFSTATNIDAGSAPIPLVASDGTRYVYYLSGTTIKVAYNFDLVP